MPTVPTPRTGIEIVFEDTLTGNFATRVFNGIPGTPDPYPYCATLSLVRFPWGGTVEFGSGAGKRWDDLSPEPVDNTHFAVTSGLTLVAFPGMDPVYGESVDDELEVSYSPPGQADVSTSLIGTVSVTVLCDEYLYYDYLDATEAVYYPDPDLPGSLPFPVTGGNAMPDCLPARKSALFVVPTEGQTVVVTATVNGSSVSDSFVWPAGTPWYHGLYHELNAASGGVSAQCTADPYVQGVRLFEQADHSHHETDADWLCDGSLSVSSSGTETAETNGGLEADAEIPTVYTLKASVVAASGDPCPGALSVSHPGGTLALSGGAGEKEIKQRSWYVVDSLATGIVATAGLSNEKGHVTAHLPQSDLEGDGDDERDWRLLFRTYRFPGMSLSHDASVEVVAAGAAWSGGAPGGLGLVLNPGESATCSLPGGTPDHRVWEAYRYLDVRLKSVGGANAALGVSLANDRITKRYKAKSGADGTAVTHRIDTCSPTNLPDGFELDGRDGPFPLRYQVSHADGPIATGPEESASYLDDALEPGESAGDDDAIERKRGWLYGANRIATITLSNDSEATIEVGALSLARAGSPKVTLSESFKAQGVVTSDRADATVLWTTTAAGGDTTEIAKARGGPFFSVLVDGRVGMQFPGSWFRRYLADDDFEWVFPSVSDLALWPNAFLGCASSDSGGSNFFTDTGSCFALELGGNGSDYDGSTWTHWIDRPLGTVPVQILFDWFQGWPGGGSMDGKGGEWGWPGSSYDAEVGGPWVLAVGKHLRSRAEGIAFQDDSSANPGDPLVGATILFQEDGGATWGTSVSDARGVYLTDLPGGRGNKDAKTVLMAGSEPYEESRARSRYLSRTSFRAVRVESGKILAFLSRGDGRLFRVIDKSGTAWLGVSDVPTYSTWIDRDMGLPADEASLQKGRGKSVVIGLIKAGTLTLYIDASEGREAPITSVTEGSATSHDVAAYGDGIDAIVRIDGGTVKITLRNARDLSLVAGPYTTDLTGLDDDDTIRADDVRLPGNRPGLIVTIGRGSTTTTYLTKDLIHLVP